MIEVHLQQLCLVKWFRPFGVRESTESWATLLLTFFNFPAAHSIHLRTTNANESTFATVKARTRMTKGAGSRNVGLAMAFKLLLEGESWWRQVNSPHLVAIVHAGMKFPDGKTRILPDRPKVAEQAVLKIQEDAANLASIQSI